ncbi:MAG TPA: 2'-5' RNA ligase family protein [Thermomicrobiales bacterium]|nr:2'-5' RNA ligase family protein [Thermomicrobiales bacterium]
MPDTTIPHGCFIVLDLPERVGVQILRIRHLFRDPYRTELPVEITVAGSSGVGVMVPGQSRASVFATLDAIAMETAPFAASFGPVKRFPNTDIFVLSLRDRAPFDALHHRIVESGIRFQESPHDFTPHCTLCRRSPLGGEDVAALMATEVPGEFTIDTLAVYRADPLPATLLYRVKLTGNDRSDHKNT